LNDDAEGDDDGDVVIVLSMDDRMRHTLIRMERVLRPRSSESRTSGRMASGTAWRRRGHLVLTDIFIFKILLELFELFSESLILELEL
jgi:hypothetical protein